MAISHALGALTKTSFDHRVSHQAALYRRQPVVVHQKPEERVCIKE